MTRLRALPIPAILGVLVTLLAAMAVVRPAWAGALHVRDEAHLLSADDVAKLRAAAAEAPFDVRLAVTGDYPDPESLSRYTGSLVNEPNLVAIVLDTQHHHVQVHFGTESGVPKANWAAIDQAGNAAFRRADWEGGCASILREAAHAASAGRAATGASQQEAAPSPSLLGPGLLVVLVAAALGVGIYFARRRAMIGGAPGQGYAGSAYGPGAGYPVGPMPGGGIGPVGGGLIGAGLGGIAGYELGKLEGEREERDRDERVGRADVNDERAPQDFDAGGGGSSWDDDGGGFDGGDGGGGDAGGGGSDFGA